MKKLICIAALTAATASLSAGAITANGAARLTRASSEAAVEKKVAAKHPRLTEDRFVVAQCRRRTAREYYCLYGIHANFDDAMYDPETRYVYSGVAYTKLRRGRVVADVLRAYSGDTYAP
ncbi:MAG: hypothetical protein WKF96_08070 [Solirubrobacteraceae bacterium]